MLQEIGTVPMIDVLAYAKIFNRIEADETQSCGKVCQLETAQTTGFENSPDNKCLF